MSDVKVPVHTWISGPAFQALERRARRASTTVAVIVAHVAEAEAAKEPQRPVRRYVRMTAEIQVRIADLHLLHYGPRAIQREVGVSLRAVEYEIARLKEQQG